MKRLASFCTYSPLRNDVGACANVVVASIAHSKSRSFLIVPSPWLTGCRDRGPTWGRFAGRFLEIDEVIGDNQCHPNDYREHEQCLRPRWIGEVDNNAGCRFRCETFWQYRQLANPRENGSPMAALVEIPSFLQ
jgi:hypothetical protein